MADPTPEELAADADAADDFTFLFTWLDDDDRWVRDAKQYKDLGLTDPQVATDQFWSERDPQFVLLSCCLQGTVATVDEPMYADEPDVNDYAEELDEYDGSNRPRHHYTVFAVWNSDGTGYRRWSKFIEAVDPLHAELIARDQTRSGDFLVCGVVELYVPVVDLAEFDVYASPDGKPPAPREPEPRRRRWFS